MKIITFRGDRQTEKVLQQVLHYYELSKSKAIRIAVKKFWSNKLKEIQQEDN